MTDTRDCPKCGGKGVRGFHADVSTACPTFVAPASVQDQERPIVTEERAEDAAPRLCPECDSAPSYDHKSFGVALECDNCGLRTPYTEGMDGVLWRWNAMAETYASVPPAPPIAKAGEPPAWAVKGAHDAFHLSDDQAHAARLIYAAYLASPEAGKVEALLYTSDKQTFAWKNRAEKAEARVERLTELLRRALDGLGVTLREQITAALAESADRGEEKANG